MGERTIVKNYIYNTLYQILLMIAPVITIPYVSRVLGVTNLGIYNYAQSIATYFVLVGAVGTTLYGQREIAYYQDNPEKRTKAFWEVELFRIIVVSISLIIYLIVFCTHGNYKYVYTILAMEVLANAFDISWFFMGMENFKIIVIRNTVIKLVGISCVLLFVKSTDDLWIYTTCVTAPLLVGNVSLWFALKENITKVHLNKGEIANGIKERLRPIILLFLPQIATNVYTVLDKTMIGLLSSSIDQVGYYSQSQNIVRVVLAIVTSLGTVMLPAMSATFARGEYQGIIKSITMSFRFVYMLSFPLMFGLCAITSHFVPLFFGEGYAPVIPLMIFISPIVINVATSNVVGRQFLIPTNQHRFFTISIITGACTNVVMNVILIPTFDAIGASIASVFAELTVAGVQCWFVRKQLPLKDCLLPGVKYLFLSGIMFFVVKGVGLFLPHGKIWAVEVMVIIGVTIYLLELKIIKDPMMKVAFDFINNKCRVMQNKE